MVRMPRRALLGCALLALLLAACEAKLPNIDSIRDSRLFDRRIEETPRQKVVRECRQETDRFRVTCTFCHTNGDENKIASPDKLLLTESGRRAQIMRSSPTFGLHQQCSACHQSKFKLTKYADSIFGPKGAKRREMEEELLKKQQEEQK